MSVVAIRGALETQLNAFATAQSLPVAWENVPIGGAKPHLRVNLLPAPTVSDTLDGLHRGYRGVLQVLVVCDINRGTGRGGEIADALAAAFPVNYLLPGAGLTVQITGPASVAPGLQGEAEYVIPVSIPYRADTT